MGNPANLRYDAATKRAADAIRLAIGELRIAASMAPSTSNAYDAAMLKIRELEKLTRCEEPMAAYNFERQAREPHQW